MIKKIGYAFLVVVLLLIIVGFIGIRKFNSRWFKEKPNYLVYTAEDKPVHFRWGNDSIGNLIERKTAMTIPVKINGLAHRFFVQFDTGSPYSFIYEKDLISLKKLGLNLDVIKNEDGQYIKEMDFDLGGSQVQLSMIKILSNYGNTFTKNDTASRIKIGTIGSDFLVNRITAIDFKNQSIQFHLDRPTWMEALPEFERFNFQGRRFMLPVSIMDRKLELLYDSGCSAFGLITSKYRYDKYTDENVPEIKYGANSWGSSIPICHRSTEEMMWIGGTKLGLKRISFVNMYAKYQKFISPFTRIGGWLGNRPFTESVLILDTQKEEFAVVAPK